MDFVKHGADILAIQDLLAAYAYHFDAFDSQAWSETFIEDGRITPDLECVQPAIGRAALKQMADAPYEQVSSVIHVTSTQRVLKVEGDRATGYAYFYCQGLLKNGGRFLQAGRYDDVYQRTAESWTFASRNEVNLLPPDYVGFDMSKL